MKEIYISPDDIKQIFLRSRYKLRSFGLMIGVVVFGLCLLRSPQYVAEATFKQSSGKIEQSLDLKNLLKTMVSHDSESSTISLMFSKKLLRRCIETLGWQATVPKRHIFGRIKDNLLAEMGSSLSEQDVFVFRNVFYDGEDPSRFYLRFLTEDSYEILSHGKGPISRAKIGEKVQFGNVHLTLIATPKTLALGKLYPLDILPWKPVVESAKKHLSIKTEKLDRMILNLSFSHRNRFFAADFLNCLMTTYQTFLKEENDLLSAEQLKFLSKRQDELGAKLDKMLSEHVVYLQSSLGENGFIDLQHEIETLSSPKEHYTSRLFELELEQSRLETATYFPKNPYHLAQNQMEEALSILECVEKDKPIPTPKENKGTLASLVAQLNVSQEKESLRTELAAYLREFIQNLHVKNKASSYAEVFESDFRGIDLPMAKNLYTQYNNQLDDLEVSLRQLLFLRDQMEDPQFELSSLCNVLTDSITAQLVQKASELELQLRDEANRSSREHDRFREALQTQKRFLHSHMTEVMDLQKIRIELVKGKIASLQLVMLDLMKQERKLIEGKLVQLRCQMTDLPEKWRVENQLKFKTELTKGMMEGLTQITESKSLSSHLYQVESKPLDRALAPHYPRAPHLLLYSALSGAAGAFILFLWIFLSKAASGLPLSLERLKILRQYTSGKLSSDCDAPFIEISQADLETLRHVASFLFSQKGRCVGLFGGSNPDYSHNLAEILLMKGAKILVIECDFDRVVSKEDVPGLWHYLTGEISAPPIRSNGKWDFLKTSGTTRHGTEILGKDRFTMLLTEILPRYDFVIIYSRAPFASSEAEVLFNFVDTAIVTLCEETLEEISSFIEKQYVTFVHCEAPPL